MEASLEGPIGGEDPDLACLSDFLRERGYAVTAPAEEARQAPNLTFSVGGSTLCIRQGNYGPGGVTLFILTPPAPDVPGRCDSDYAVRLVEPAPEAASGTPASQTIRVLGPVPAEASGPSAVGPPEPLREGHTEAAVLALPIRLPAVLPGPPILPLSTKDTDTATEGDAAFDFTAYAAAAGVPEGRSPDGRSTSGISELRRDIAAVVQSAGSGGPNAGGGFSLGFGSGGFGGASQPNAGGGFGSGFGSGGFGGFGSGSGGFGGYAESKGRPPKGGGKRGGGHKRCGRCGWLQQQR
jgi:hypothetical protein